MPATPATTPTRWKRRLGALFLGLVLSLAVVEASLSWLDLPRTRPFLQELYAREARLKLMCFDEDPWGIHEVDLRDPQDRATYEAFWDASELARCEETPYGVVVRYNSLGFREEEPRAPQADRIRLCVLGDSFVYGHGLPAELSLPRQLGQSLPRLADREVEVLNCGLGGFDLDRLVPALSLVLERLQPEVLVYAYFLNDPLPSPETPQLPFVHPGLDPSSTRVENTPRRLALGGQPRPLLRSLAFWQELSVRSRVHENTLAWYLAIHEPRAWGHSGDAIAEMSERAEAAGCRFLVAILPVVFQVGPEYPLAQAHTQIQRQLEQRGVEVLDCLPALRKFSDRELSLHPADRHPSPTYARTVAKTIADYLSQR